MLLTAQSTYCLESYYPYKVWEMLHLRYFLQLFLMISTLYIFPGLAKNKALPLPRVPTWYPVHYDLSFLWHSGYAFLPSFGKSLHFVFDWLTYKFSNLFFSGLQWLQFKQKFMEASLISWYWASYTLSSRN